MLPFDPEQIRPLEKVAVATSHATPCGWPHVHEGQTVDAVSLISVPPLVTSVGKPLAVVQAGGDPEPYQWESGPTQPPPGVGGAQL